MTEHKSRCMQCSGEIYEPFNYCPQCDGFTFDLGFLCAHQNFATEWSIRFKNGAWCLYNTCFGVVLQ